MEQIKYEKRCYLCSVIYGILGSLGFICIWSNDLLFTIIFGIVIAVITLTLVINIISIVRIKSIFQKIKIIFCEILIAIVLNIVFVYLWLAILESIYDFFSALFQKI